MLVPVSLVALLLAAEGDHDPHFGAELGLGFGVPFNLASAGFQLGAKPYVEVDVAPKVAVGVSLPVELGFSPANGNSSFASINFTSVDIMPGLRGSYAVLDWVFVALDVGLGPNILITKTDINVFGTTSSQSDTHTFFAMRVGLEVLAAPPQLHGVTLALQPLEINGRVGNGTYSEYRFAVLVGFRH